MWIFSSILSLLFLCDTMFSQQVIPVTAIQVVDFVLVLFKMAHQYRVDIAAHGYFPLSAMVFTILETMLCASLLMYTHCRSFTSFRLRKVEP